MASGMLDHFSGLGMTLVSTPHRKALDPTAASSPRLLTLELLPRLHPTMQMIYYSGEE
jgi:hypothetical protein